MFVASYARKRKFTWIVRWCCGFFATKSVKRGTSNHRVRNSHIHPREVGFEQIGEALLLLVKPKPKPSQDNSNHVKSSWIRPPNDTVEDSTLHLLKLQSVQFQVVAFRTTVVNISSSPSSKSSDSTHPFVFNYPFQPR